MRFSLRQADCGDWFEEKSGNVASPLYNTMMFLKKFFSMMDVGKLLVRTYKIYQKVLNGKKSEVVSAFEKIVK